MFNLHDNLMKCMITLLHLLLRKRKTGSQGSELASPAFTVGNRKIKSLAGRLASELLRGTALGLWPGTESRKAVIKEEIPFLNKGLIVP